jgi:GrpB-like predicted nucleotidyltransferase (UPF0157 family)
MDTVRFHPYEEIREQAEAAFREHHARLSSLLPYADIQHVGSTAISGARTKGDLTEDFASFQDETLPVPLGIQLTAMGRSRDFFSEARDRLRAAPALVAEYDALKAQWEGGDMEAYREEKSAFFEKLLGSR